MKAVAMIRFFIFRALIYLFLIVLAFTYLYPVYFMIINSVKTQVEYMMDPFNIIMKNIKMNNYYTVFVNFNILKYSYNTLLVTVLKLVFILPITICTSYSFAKIKFKGRSKLYLAIMITMFIPFQVIMIPIYVFFAKIKLLDTFTGFILLGVASGLPGTILLLTANFRGIPNELIESGKLDGCGFFRTVWNIIMPLGIPAISISVIIGFIGGWNDMLAPMLILKSVDKMLIMPALSMLVSQYVRNVPFQMTGLLLASIPAVAVYLILQRQIIMGISVGALK
jgi:ABC-type glycerol-3-phosphate transport system permease component